MHIHVPSIIYRSRLIVVVFQETNCLHTFKLDIVCRVTELHLSTQLHACQCCGYSEICELKEKNSEIDYFPM